VSSSEHFVIYADDSERDIQRFSERLEQYHSALASFFSSRSNTPSPSNRITVYVVKNQSEVRRLFGEGGRDIGGFYIPRAGGSVAIIPPVNTSRGTRISQSERVLLHEYAHHFQHENLPFLMPRWYVEGFAEYFSTARFESDAVFLGLPAEHRAAELSDFTIASQVRIEELLEVQAYGDRESSRYNNFYGRSWALFHYLFSTQEGRVQMTDYLKRLNYGESELEAATSAFGDLAELDNTLDKYIGSRKFLSWKMDAAQLRVGEITVRKLNKAEAAAMPVRIRSKRGVNSEQAAELVISARELAALYPEEAEVQAVLAEAEFDAGNNEAAIRAADLALAQNPVHINALIQKGRALTSIAVKTGEADDWSAARKHFVEANRVEVDHPEPLVSYYQTFVMQGQAPSAAAVDGLKWAQALAPFDGQLRMLTAVQLMNEERFAEAINVLTPLAYNPHNTSDDNPARRLMAEARLRLEN
jgi:tetratricopeptide (TPR) repeat protein